MCNYLEDDTHPKRDRTKPLPHAANHIIDAIYAAFQHFQHIQVHSFVQGRNYICLNLAPANYPQLDEVRALRTGQGWIVVERHLSRRFPGQMAVIFPGFKMIRTEKKWTKIVARVSYDDREQAKSLGYTWNPDAKEWSKEIDSAHLDECLAAATFQYSLSHRPRTITSPSPMTPLHPRRNLVP
jgi:hypothetical protein